MIKDAHSKRLIEVISPNDNRLFLIPKYQRGYAWRKKNWEQLLDDIFEADKGYYVGSIICVTGNTENGTDYPIIDIVDGQQRITTFNLLLIAIYSYLDDIKDKYIQKYSEDEFTSLKVEIKKRIVSKDNEGNLRPRLSLSRQEQNSMDYEYLLSEEKLLPEKDSTKNAGNRKIWRCFYFFQDYLDDLIKESFDKFIDFYNKINDIQIVKIDVGSVANAFILFETLNDRGIPLSSMDLIKNKILAELEKQNGLSGEEIDKEVSKWHTIIDRLEENSDQIRFLRQYYFAYKNSQLIKDVEAKLKKKLPTKPTKSNVVEIYDSCAKYFAKDILDDLAEKSKIYADFINSNGSNKHSKHYLDLLRIGTAPAYSFLLLCETENIFSDEQYVILLEIIKLYFIKRNITDYPNTNKLDQIFAGIIDTYYSNNKNISLKEVFEYLFDEKNERHAKDDDFYKAINNDMYFNYEVCRYILSKIEESFRINTRETKYPDLWSKGKSDKYIFTIEHILLEGKNLKEYWVKILAEGNTEKASELQEEYAHRIGNLTLTAYNPNLSNSEFKVKRDKKDKEDNYIGYKNGLFLNKEILNLETLENWTINDIKKRTELMLDKVKELFSIDKLKNKIMNS